MGTHETPFTRLRTKILTAMKARWTAGAEPTRVRLMREDETLLLLADYSEVGQTAFDAINGGTHREHFSKLFGLKVEWDQDKFDVT